MSGRNPYRCKQGNHYTDKEHNGKTCPYDNMSIRELAENEKIEIKSEIASVSPKTVLNYKNMSSKQRQKSIRNHKKQLSFHLERIKNPEKYVDNWNTASKKYQNGIVSWWAKEVVNIQNQIKVLEKIENERKWSII